MQKSNVIPIDTAKLKTKKDYALAYAAIGWHVLPLWYIKNDGTCACGKCSDDNNSRGKHPVTAQGQNNATTDPNLISSWWDRNPNYNIGVYLSGSGLVAVDIDPRNGGLYTLESLEEKHGKIESDVLQFTGGDGQHRVFMLPKSVNNLPGGLGAGVDLKLNGYIVVEPSNHYSGGAYNWEGSSNPLDGVAPSPLPDWIRGLSTDTSEKKNYTYFESRLTNSVQVEELRSALKFINANDRPTWINVGHALKTIGAVGYELWTEYSKQSYKFEIKDQYKRWQGFTPSNINIETIFFMAKNEGWLNIQVSDDITLDFLNKTKKTYEEKPIKRLTGVLGLIEDYYNDTAKIPQPKFAQQTALSTASVLLGRKFKTVFGDFTSLYFLEIAKTANGKEHVKFVTEAVLAACGMDYLLAGDGYTSAGAVISVLEKKPAHISVIDELGLYLEAALNKNNQTQKTANTMLMECIGRLNGDVRSKNYSTQSGISKKESVTVKHPAITLQSMTTPSTFYASLTPEMIKDGFLGRFIISHSHSERVPARRRREIPVNELILDWVEKINMRVGDKAGAFQNSGIVGDIQVLEVNEDADDHLLKFSEEMVSIMNDLEKSGIEGIVGRVAEFAGRLALIIELSSNPFSKSVTLESATLAVDYMRDRARETIMEIKEHLVGSEFQKIKNEILAAIKSVKDGVTTKDMHRKAPFTKYKDKELTEALQSLSSGGLIALINTREGMPGRARNAFFALDFDESVNRHE